MTYGLVGEKLGHSYSKLIHEMLGRYTYNLFSLDKNTFEAFWGKFENDFMEIISQETEKEDKKSTPKINVAEAVEEILQLVRSQNAMINSPTKIIPPE